VRSIQQPEYTMPWKDWNRYFPEDNFAVHTEGFMMRTSKVVHKDPLVFNPQGGSSTHWAAADRVLPIKETNCLTRAEVYELFFKGAAGVPSVPTLVTHEAPKPKKEEVPKNKEDRNREKDRDHQLDRKLKEDRKKASDSKKRGSTVSTSSATTFSPPHRSNRSAASPSEAEAKALRCAAKDKGHNKPRRR